MKGYKAFNKGFICNGFQYEVGKEYVLDGKLEICKNGFHFCENLVDVFGYYDFDREKTVLAEVEATGNIRQLGTKFCTDKIRILRAVDWSEVDAVIKVRPNIGDGNSGSANLGDFNSGDYNSGDYNSGEYNSGDYNSGNYNSGDYNSGNCNSGYCNSGNHNSGNCNSGKYNSGDYNSGNYNSGYCNSGDYNSGFFNSDEPTVRLFNKDSGMTFEEFFALDIDCADLRKSKGKIQSLPNYDAEIFYAATGIDWRGETDGN